MSTVSNLLIGTNGIIRENTSFTLLVKPSKNIKGIVRKKALEVKRVGEKLGHSRTAHLLVMLMLINL